MVDFDDERKGICHVAKELGSEQALPMCAGPNRAFPKQKTAKPRNYSIDNSDALKY